MVRRFAGVVVLVLWLVQSSIAIVIAAPVWDALDPVAESALRRAAARRPAPAKYHAARLNRAALADVLSRAPMEFSNVERKHHPIIELPMPDGTLARFSFEESPIVEPGLAEKYPELRTYRAQGLDEKSATARFDWLPSGFHAMILGPSGTVLIDPHDTDADHYLAFHKHDVPKNADGFVCDAGGDDEVVHAITKAAAAEAAAASTGPTLRTYRLALAATNEYAVAAGGNTIAGTLAAEVVIMNRVNGIFERELGIRMVLVANNDLITYAGNSTRCAGPCNGANDPYTNSNGTAMLTQNQANTDVVIGPFNYDIGHVFSTGGGGVASVGVVCGLAKARGVTGLSNPVGDVFAIDYVAHELGHQWGASHTFNGTTSACSGNRTNSSAYEPGSAVTIMGYAGICGGQNLAAHSIDTFHVKSLEAIGSYSQNGGGNLCAVQTLTANSAPFVGGPGNFTIPKGTPFALTATASDPDGDAVTYDWQEFDLDAGGAGTSESPNSDADGVARPIFRAYAPTTSPTRTFPSLKFILNNANVPPATTTGGYLTGELLPSISRTMQFKVVARDNRAGGGGVSTATSAISVNGAAGPFAVTSQNTFILVPPMSAVTVTWDVAGTSGPPVSASSVRISLSTDGGLTFPTVLAASTPNDGAATVTLPDVRTSGGRIKVEAVGNVFFDISNANFAIGTVLPTLDIDASSPSTKYDALSDGLLLIRYLFGLTGNTLTSNALGPTATRVDPLSIKGYLDEIRPSLDIDGNGKVDALTDGLLALRYLFGVRGSDLTAGAIGGLATRTTASAIETYIQTLMP